MGIFERSKYPILNCYIVRLIRSPSDPLSHGRDNVALEANAKDWNEAEALATRFGARQSGGKCASGKVGLDNAYRIKARSKRFHCIEIRKGMTFCNNCDNSDKCREHNTCFAEQRKEWNNETID